MPCGMYVNVMQPNQNTSLDAGNRQAALTTLAVVGFLALVAFGIYLAIYSARYVPNAVSKLDAAAVSLASVFSPAATSSLAVIPASSASTTIAFGDDSTTTVPVAPTAAPVKPAAVIPQAGAQTSGTYQISGGTGPTSYTGLPDLTVAVDAVGYLTTDAADSFVAASTVPAGYRPAVEFTIKNIGTNVAEPWRFSATIPTTVGYTYQSNEQQSLNPGDSIDYTLGFDDATVGTNETISITANFDHAVAESNTSNDSATASVTVQ
jgi:hypothetical protein